jgi:hypothetical protein
MPGRLGRRLLVVALPVALVGALAVPAIGYEWSADDAGPEGLPPEVGIGATWQVADAGAIQANGDLMLLDHGPATVDTQDEGLTAQKAAAAAVGEVNESDVLVQSVEATTTPAPEEAVTDGTPAPDLIPAAPPLIRDYVSELLLGPATGPDADPAATVTATPTPTPDKCQPAGATVTPTQGGASPTATPTATPTPGGTPCPTNTPVGAPGLGQPPAEGGVRIPLPVGPGGFPLPLPGSGGGGHAGQADTPPTAQPTAQPPTQVPAAAGPAAPAPAAPTVAPAPAAPPAGGPAPPNPVVQKMNELVNEIWETAEEYREELDEAIESGKDTLHKGGELWQDPTLERAVEAVKSAGNTLKESIWPGSDPTWSPARRYIRRYFDFNLAGEAGQAAASPPEDLVPEPDH